MATEIKTPMMKVQTVPDDDFEFDRILKAVVFDDDLADYIRTELLTKFPNRIQTWQEFQEVCTLFAYTAQYAELDFENWSVDGYWFDGTNLWVFERRNSSRKGESFTYINSDYFIIEPIYVWTP